MFDFYSNSKTLLFFNSESVVFFAQAGEADEAEGHREGEAGAGDGHPEAAASHAHEDGEGAGLHEGGQSGVGEQQLGVPHGGGRVPHDQHPAASAHRQPGKATERAAHPGGGQTQRVRSASAESGPHHADRHRQSAQQHPQVRIF